MTDLGVELGTKCFKLVEFLTLYSNLVCIASYKCILAEEWVVCDLNEILLDVYVDIQISFPMFFSSACSFKNKKMRNILFNFVLMLAYVY
jgi:hypothetical protein